MTKQLPYYEKEGIRYDRITAILDYFTTPELLNWKLRVGKKEAGLISRRALKVGSTVDENVRAMINKSDAPKLKSFEEKNCWKAFEQWRSDYPGELIELETVYDVEQMVAGTPDIFHVGDGILIDVKCSARVSSSYWLQTEFYLRNLKGVFSKEVPKKAILRLDKNLGIYEYKVMNFSDEHWNVVRGLISAYRYYKSVTDGKGDNDECNANTSASNEAL